MNHRIITDFEELSRLRSCWERLWASRGQRDIFNSFSYVEAWWNVHRANYRVFTPVVSGPDGVLAILPLIADGETLRFFCFSDADYNDILLDTRHAEQGLRGTFAALMDARSQWTRCSLDNVRENSPLLPWLSRPAQTLLFSSEVQNVCPTLNLRDDAASEFDRLLGKKPLTQEEKRLQRFGELRFRHIEDRNEALRHLPLFFRQHTQRWALEGTYGRFTQARSRAFYQALVARLDLATELRFSVLEAGPIALAYHLGFELEGRFLFFKPTFDIDYWDFSPGKVLLRRLLQYARDKALVEFDFSIGDEDYKHKYANVVRRNHRIKIANERWVSRADLALNTAKQSIKAVVRGGIGMFRRDRMAVRKWHRRYRESRVRVLPATSSAVPPAFPGAKLKAMPLSALADLSLERPAFFPAAELAEVRRRHKEGDSFILLEQGGELSGAWKAGSQATAPSACYKSLRASSVTAMKTFLLLAGVASAQEGMAEMQVSAISSQSSLLKAVAKDW